RPRARAVLSRGPAHPGGAAPPGAAGTRAGARAGMTAVVGRTRAALADAAGAARAGWRGLPTVLLCLFALACAVPWIAPGWVHVDELAAWLYLALSATGLVAAVGLAGLASLDPESGV